MLMTPARATRPVPIAAALALSLALAGCGVGVEDDGGFEALADHVAAIDVPLSPGGSEPKSAGMARTGGFSPVQVAVMDPHDMWDARDAQNGLRVMTARVVEPVAESGKPIAVKAAAERTTARLRGAEPPSAPEGPLVQLGAYASEAAARQAWARLSRDPALGALTPRFETVTVGERTLTRLKVGATGEASSVEVCRAAGIDDPWCRRAG